MNLVISNDRDSEHRTDTSGFPESEVNDLLFSLPFLFRTSGFPESAANGSLFSLPRLPTLVLILAQWQASQSELWPEPVPLAVR
jgi:hypothetical protein